MISKLLRRAGQLVALAVVVAMTTMGCAPSQQDTGGGSSSEVPDTITIGATLPLTGTESKAGGRQKELDGVYADHRSRQ